MNYTKSKTTLKNNLDEINVYNNSKNGMIHLIDIKIENNMKEVIQKINSFENKINEFEKINLERIGNLKWTIIVASGVITLLLTVLTIVLSTK